MVLPSNLISKVVLEFEGLLTTGGVLPSTSMKIPCCKGKKKRS
jgi:hypothetical protein